MTRTVRRKNKARGVGVKSNVNEEGTESTLKGTWDWERESKIREVCEEMERWAIKAQLRRDPLLVTVINLLITGALGRGKQLTMKCALQRGKCLLS
ncbi:penicillin-binding protein 1A-like [Gossypium australe]|uniref:Penicillin-binding protein 1A-like n=1 Tax=Gossypium australe TaxID=47621 RepID=A0A5B6W631_9ROSI|nr:penicillin-binding protein 1A-like [Gossypium australe]